MPKINIFNLNGEIVGDLELNPKIFDIKINPNLVHQAVVTQLANKRSAISDTLTKAEVRGGGKKPWKQKGTGRARVGSIRSPLWRGGGVTFGPTSEKNFSLDLNKKMKKKALAMALTDKVRENKMVLLENIELKDGKTKEMKSAVEKLINAEKKNTKVLIAYVGKNPKLINAVSNLKTVKGIGANSLNIVDVLKYDYLILEKEGLKTIEALYAIK